VLAERIAHEIRRRGPIPADEVIDLALYDPDEGFYATQGSAGRRGDFITSPEVGPLFGAVLARALDAWWAELGRPDPFVVVEAGAGAGTLARSILSAGPACGSALRYVLVERSAALRARHGEHLALEPPAFALPPGEHGDGPKFISLEALPAVRTTGVVLANELLDNLAFRLVERHAGAWYEVRVARTGDGPPLVEQLVPADDSLAERVAHLVPDAAEGARLPVQDRAADWVRTALGLLERGRVVVIDYAGHGAELAARPSSEWLRTYRAHQRGGHWVDDLGSQDITCEVDVDQLARVHHPASDRTQAEFLRAHGIDQLVDEGRRIWEERAHVGDLAAVRARSRVAEAEALTDPSGLGAFRVLEWTV
jgi:SAM-dependent MidA family methyltransferase